MNKTIRHSFQKTSIYIETFIKWFLFSSMTGLVCGLIGSLFYYCVLYANKYRTTYPALLFLLPIGGLVIVFLYRFLHMAKDKGTNLVIGSIRSDEEVPLKMTFLIFVSTVITHLFGGSAGREGAALQIGGGLGSSIGKLFRLDEKDHHLITMCGMSAVFSALFGTPLTATIFSMEVISVGLMHYSALIPCLFSSLIAYGVACLFHITPETYIIKVAPQLGITSFFQLILLGMICAIISIFFCVSMHASSKFIQHEIKDQYIRVIVSGVLIILLTLLVGNRDYNGAGTQVIARAIGGHANSLAFLLKIIFTTITLCCGYKGGEIVPTFFIGATLGCVVGPLFGLPASFAAAAGMIGLFCGVVNCPIASLILSVELFGSDYLLLFAIVCSVSYMLSGSYSLYSTQRIVYSKLKPKYINMKTK